MNKVKIIKEAKKQLNIKIKIIKIELQLYEDKNRKQEFIEYVNHTLITEKDKESIFLYTYPFFKNYFIFNYKTNTVKFYFFKNENEKIEIKVKEKISQIVKKFLYELSAIEIENYSHLINSSMKELLNKLQKN
jgi:hypothetical protein